MRYAMVVLGALFLLGGTACTKKEMYSGPALPPNGLKDTGSAGPQGGAASAPAGTGVVGRSSP